jgi:hypothetical protein
MTSERVFYSDVNGIRAGTHEIAFGERKYGTRSISRAQIVTEQRRSWPGIIVMVIGWALIGGGYLNGSTDMMIAGAAGFLGGSFYFKRHKPRYAIRLSTTKGDFLVVASGNKPFLEEVLAAIHRAMDALRADRG